MILYADKTIYQNKDQDFFVDLENMYLFTRYSFYVYKTLVCQFPKYNNLSDFSTCQYECICYSKSVNVKTVNISLSQ